MKNNQQIKSFTEKRTQLRKGDIVTVQITELAQGGAGCGFAGDWPCYVNGAYPGDVVEAELFRVKRRETSGNLKRLVVEKIPRIKPRCSHFGICGGCSFQDIAYKDQLELKENLAFGILKEMDGFRDTEFLPIVPSEGKFFYRNKMEFSFAPGEGGEPGLGLHPRGKWYEVFDLVECFLQSPTSNRVIEIFRRYTRKNRLMAYHQKSRSGFLRYLTIREGKNTQEFLFHLITTEGKLPGINELVDEIDRAVEGRWGLVHSVTGRKAGVAHGERSRVIWGMGYIRETIGDLTFRVSPDSFFQTNTHQGEKLYRTIREFAGLTGNEVLFDLYCGTGIIGLFCAKKARKVIGVEIVGEAIRDAVRNAEWNGITNIRFIEGDARKILDDLPKVDVAVCDPPRPGLHPRVLEKLAEMEPERIGYVSCNPYVMGNDLSRFIEYLYKPVKVQCFDMFPQTPHIETVVLLERA